MELIILHSPYIQALLWKIKQITHVQEVAINYNATEPC